MMLRRWWQGSKLLQNVNLEGHHERNHLPKYSVHLGLLLQRVKTATRCHPRRRLCDRRAQGVVGVRMMAVDVDMRGPLVAQGSI